MQKKSEKETAQGVMSTAGLADFWVKKRPDYACVVLTRHKYKSKYEYNLFRFEWVVGEPPDDSADDDENVTYYYLAWLDNDGDEWGDVNECNYDEYLVIEKLPTLEELG